MVLSSFDSLLNSYKQMCGFCFSLRSILICVLRILNENLWFLNCNLLMLGYRAGIIALCVLPVKTFMENIETSMNNVGLLFKYFELESDIFGLTNERFGLRVK